MSVEFSPNLEKRLIELNNGYPPQDMSIGRLIQTATNPYGTTPGISGQQKKELNNIISAIGVESLHNGIHFVQDLLLAKYKLQMPNYSSPQFKEVENYQQYLQILLTLPRKNTRLSQSAKDNIKSFQENPNSGYFKNTSKISLEMRVWIPENQGPILKISFRTKLQDSFREKIFSRFINLHQKWDDKKYQLEGSLGKAEVTGKEIITEYYTRFKNSGKDLYEFILTEHPSIPLTSCPKKNTKLWKEIEEMKKDFLSIFPIDYVGVKITTKTRAQAQYLGQEVIELSQYLGYPIIPRLCEDNIKGRCKDNSITIGVGSKINYRILTEIKIQSIGDELEGEMGKDIHFLYKKKKYDENRKALETNDFFQRYYDSLKTIFS